MKKVAVLLALVLASAALVACGDDDGTTTTPTDTGGEATNGATTGGGGGGGGGSTIQIEADPSGGLAFASDQVSAKAGEATLEFTNPQPVGHDADIEDSSGKEVAETEVISESSESVAIKDLEPGEYTFYCSVPGHREAGMEGTLTVE
jgi:plastocyanin